MKLVYVFLIVSLFVAANASVEEEGDEFEGDIILTSEQRTLIEEGKDLALEGSMQRGASKTNRWPGGVVPYIIDKSLAGDSETKQLIIGAIREWSQKTCLKFKPRSKERGYISFESGLSCASLLGYLGDKQKIELGFGCMHHGIVVHEIGHALGFWHEQSRPDRDNYVTILWDNIYDHKKHNFKKITNSRIDSLNVPYDYGSIMHYGPKAFSKNYKETIKTNNGEKIGQRNGLSALDVKQMNLMYKCDEGGLPLPTKAPIPCEDNNLCYLHTKRCDRDWVQKNCKKMCNLCETTPTKPSPTYRPRPTNPRPTYRPPTQAPTQAPTSGGCRDTWTQCSKYLKYCKTMQWLKKSCKKSCNLC